MARGGEKKTVVVIGGGCSGTLAAVHLLRAWCDGPLSVVIVEPEIAGLGVAYSTPFESHLLNSPAAAMSAYPDRPQDFVEWATRRSGAACAGSDFLSRRLYGKYLQSVLADASRGSSPSRSLTHISGKITNIDRYRPDGRLLVGLEAGGRIQADDVVLALGNLPPANPPLSSSAFYRSDRYVPDPWPTGALEGIEGPVLLLGSGLTAVDVALALQDLGHNEQIRAVSRRGLLPQTHRPKGAISGHDSRTFEEMLASHEMSPLRVPQIMSWLRQTAERTGDWSVAVDHLRPHIQDIWSTMSDQERSRFIRHAHRYWEVHRHRIAPQVAARFATLIETGRLSVHVGSVERYEEDDLGVAAILRNRRSDSGSQPESFRVAHVVNCTGPQGDVTAAGHRLLDSLLVSGQVRPGPLGIGIDVDRNCEVVDARGDIGQGLWAIGPLCKGVLWETTAVPEIRAQAALLASRIARSRQSTRRGRGGTEHDRHRLDSRDEVGATQRKLVVSS